MRSTTGLLVMKAMTIISSWNSHLMRESYRAYGSSCLAATEDFPNVFLDDYEPVRRLSFQFIHFPREAIAKVPLQALRRMKDKNQGN